MSAADEVVDRPASGADVEGTATGDAPDPAARARDAVYGPLRRACADLEASLYRDLVDPLATGLEKHAEAIREVGLDGAPPEGWLERSDRLLAYRRALGSEFLEPMSVAFSSSGPSTRIQTALDEAVAAACAAVSDLPAEVDTVWSSDALREDPTDSFAQRWRKPLARVFSAARKAGEERTVALRAVAARHLETAAAEAVDELGVDALRRAAQWSGRLEVAWVEWSDASLPILVRAERPDADEDDALWESVRDSANALHASLETLVSDAADTFGAGPALERLSRATSRLDADVAVAGSMLLDPERPTKPKKRPPRRVRMAQAFESWDEGVAARFRVGISLLGILAGATAVQRRLVWRFRENCLSGVGVLPDVAAELDGLAGPLASQEMSPSSLEDLKARVERVLEPTAAAVPEPARVDKVVSEGSGSAVEALLSMVRQAPTSLNLHAESASPSRGPRPVETRPVSLQDLAGQSFDAIRIERIRSSTTGLVEAVERVRTDLLELPNIVQFAYDEAMRELEEGGSDGRARARELVTQALKSAAESIRNEVAEIEAAVKDAQGRLAKEVSGGSLALLDRVAAGRVQARLLAASSRFADLRTWINEQWGPPVDRAWARLVAAGKRFAIRVQKVFRRGTAMVGAAHVSESESVRAVQRLVDAREVIDRLPLVYQRLFTLEPLSEPGLLTGRAEELTDAVAHWNQWAGRDGFPVIVRGRQGAGVTSFLNAFSLRMQEGGTEVVRVTLTHRITDEGALAGVICEALKLEPRASLSELASLLLASSNGARRVAAVLDNLEHVHLRVPRGTDLMERLLTFMAETEAKVFWVGGITSSAWQLLQAAEPNAVAQVRVLDLAPLDADEIREALTVRHRRSGLPVRFEEPPKGRRMLRRRLRRMRDPGSYDELLEDDFFSQLEKTSAGHLRLALFQWLEAADFSAGDGVEISAPRKTDFSIFEKLSLTQSFTLKALLEHRTLTLAEHDEIFRLPRQESYQIFESLGHWRIIQVVSSKDADGQRSEIDEGLRYRIRPLLVGAVIGHLRDQNIVH